MANAGVFVGIGKNPDENAGTAIWFNGTYDGNGKTISNLIFDATKKGTALFQQAQLATIKNLTVDTVTYEGTFATKKGGAMIVGNADGCQLIGLTAKGANGAPDKRVTYNAAGIVNELSNAAGPCLVQNCTNEAAIYCSYTKAGGICPIVGGSAGRAGKGRIVIEGCVNKGTIDCTDGSFGMAGILGYSQNMTGTKVLENDEFIDDPELDNVLVIKNCVNTGTLTGGSSAKIGGILGYAWAQNYNSTKQEKSNNYGVVIFEGENKCQGDYRTVGTISSCNTIDTLEKIVSDGRVIPAGTLAVDNTYGILKASVKPEIELAKAETVTFNSNGYTWDKTGITTAAAGYEVTEAEGVFTATPKTFNITYTYTGAEDTTGIVNGNPTEFTVETSDITIDLAKITLSGYTATAADPASIDCSEQTAGVEVTITLTADAPQKWPDDPTTVAGKTAGEAFGLEGELATADAVKVATWAKAYNVAFGDKANINVEAMLLNIANDGDITAAKAEFKFTAEDLAALLANPDAATSLAEKYPYAQLTIGKFSDAACTTEWQTGDSQEFFKATLTVPQVSVKED